MHMKHVRVERSALGSASAFLIWLICENSEGTTAQLLSEVPETAVVDYILPHTGYRGTAKLRNFSLPERNSFYTLSLPV